MSTNTQTTPSAPAFEFDPVSGLIWPASMDTPAAGMSREAFEFGNRPATEEERARGHLFAASANAYARAAAELGVDAADLAERLDLVALIRAAKDIQATYDRGEDASWGTEQALWDAFRAALATVSSGNEYHKS